MQLTLEQAGLALGVAFAGVIVLLLVGTQILDWYWLALLFGATFAFGVWRMTRVTPSRYRLAQIIDERLRLHDTLSTAYIYAAGGRKGDPELLAYECEQADCLARSVDPKAVFPMRMPKALYAVGGVALVAFGMFAIRYGVTHSLDLKPNLVKIAFDAVWNTDKNAPADKKSAFQKKIEEQLKKMGIDLGLPDSDRKMDGSAETALNTMDAPKAEGTEGSESAEAKAADANEQQEPGDGEPTAERKGNSGNEENAGDQTPEAQGAPQDKQDGAKNGNNNSNNEKNNLLDKMRDAMANLLNKMKIQPKGSQTQMAKSSQKKSGQQSQSQKGSKSEGKPDSNSSESADQQGQQQGEGQQQQATQGKAGDKGAEKASNDSKSGMGKDEGDKSAKEAEQLAAMGKISEILGKRAQNISGELMVEVAGGNQQLKTAYSGKSGSHAEAGGEISRDEVPMMYRNFVQQYFEHVRRTPAPGAAKPKAAEIVGSKKPAKVSE